MAASTPTLASNPAEPAPPSGLESRPISVAEDAPPPPARGLNASRLGLAGISVLAVVLFALYAAYLASRVEDVIAPVEIAVPSKGATAPLRTGQFAADFTLTDLDGRRVSLSDYAGRPVWINVWASWCAPCRAEMPDIDAVYREVRAAETQRGVSAAGAQAEQGLALLMVSLGEDALAVRRYMNTTRYDLPVLVDPTFAFTERYRITGLPTHFFVDRAGTIRDLAIGGLKPNAMRSRLAKISG